MSSPKFELGATVRHRRAFLRSVGWYTNIPSRGTVRECVPFSDSYLVTIDWREDYGAPPRILEEHLEPVGR